MNADAGLSQIACSTFTIGAINASETKIALDYREQRADPAAVAGPEDAELATTALAQRRHQLPQFDHALTQPLCIADEIGGDRQFAVPVAARHPRIVIRQMHETRVPTEFVKAGSPAAIARCRLADMSACSISTVGALQPRAHAKRSARAMLFAGNLVLIGLRHVTVAPSPISPASPAITRNSVKIVRRKFLALRHIALKLIAAARVQAMTRLHHVH